MSITPPDREKLPRGCETILVIEDDPPMQELVREFLEDLGYKLVFAVSGLDALSLFDADPAAIQLVLTDVILPGGMSGLEAVDAIRAVRPNMPACYMTAYERAIAQIEQRGEADRCLRKPFSIERLSELVRSTIDGASPGRGSGETTLNG
jgi:CheY-like chemotaxis protein